MTNNNRETEKQNKGDRGEAAEHHSKHDAPSWARKYLDLADTAFSGGSGEESGQR